VPARKPKAKRPDPDADALARPPAAQRAGRRWKTLAEFVIGPCNRVAYASAVSVVEEPGQGANPLVIHGPVGTGKTHLLEGIYAGLRRSADARPCYVTAEEFTTRFVQASRLGKMSAFRRQFRECSALLLDNLNFLATKRATQEEFLHTFDALVSEGRQVVVTTDCHPRLADELMPELADRLLGGAVWSLLPPDSETRLEILRKKAGAGRPAIPDGVLKYVAASLRGNARELEGAVNSVRHYAKVTGRPVDQPLVREALGDLLRHAVRVVTVQDVDNAVCSVLRLAAGTLQSKARSWAVSHPRMVAVYLCRKHTAATYGEISKHFGAKTHSTAVAAEKKVRGWLDRDEQVAIGDRDWRAKELVDRIERELQR
jgi:chromosomal replication initiator protein